MEIFLAFKRLLPKAICASPKMYRCSGANGETSINSNHWKNDIVGRCSLGWSEGQSLVSRQPTDKHLSHVRAVVTSTTTQDVSDSDTPLAGDDKIGVLLLNLGGPETLEDVQPFLFNLFADPVILLSFTHKALGFFLFIIQFL